MPATDAVIRCADGAGSPRAGRAIAAATERTVRRGALLDDQPDLRVVPTERPERRGDQVHGRRPGAADRELAARPHHRQDRPPAGTRPGDDLDDASSRGCSARARTCSRTHSATDAAVGSSRSEISRVGFPPRTAAESRRMTSRSAPTIGARSVLLTTSRSAAVTPGPPLRGTLSPPATSMTNTCTSTRP